VVRLYRFLLLSVLTLTAWSFVPAQSSFADNTCDRSKLSEPRYNYRKNEDKINSVPLPPLANDRIFAAAVADVRTILGEENACSKFYGGPIAALEVLDGFASVATKETNVGEAPLLRMSGLFTTIINNSNGFTYRLFDKTTLNANSSFYKWTSLPGQPKPRPVGGYTPSSRGARAIILLHELAHLVRGSDGRWLIPDDGGNQIQSSKNTETVKKVCKEELKKLSR
jgi:hypothetical protein